VAVPQEQVPWRRTEPLPAPRRPAIEPRREVHLHFHGVSAEQAAEILRQAQDELPGRGSP
jgi:hypothetical protein